MKLITIRKKTYRIPSEWNDLNGQQLIQIMEALFVKGYEPDLLIVKLFKIIAGLSYKKLFQLKPEDIEEYLYLISFILDEKNLLTKQLITSYSNLYGPDDEISNLLMGEFAHSEGFYMQWQEEKSDIKILDKLIAVLYRPCKKNYDFERNPDGDCRLPYNDNVAIWYAENFISKWPLEVKLAISTWYAGCRQKLVDDNEDVFGGTGEPAKYGIISIMRSIAKDGTHGDFESVEKKSVSLMMLELNETVAEGKKMTEKAKNLP